MKSKNGAATDAEKQLLSLVDFAVGAEITELTWERDGRRIAFKRSAAAPVVSSAPEASAPAAKPRQRFIKSPMVGTFHRSPKDRPPLVLEGSEVSSGQKIGIVEAMQLPKDVISDVSGRIVKILIENGRPVEYGQPLFEIEPGEPSDV